MSNDNHPSSQLMAILATMRNGNGEPSAAEGLILLRAFLQLHDPKERVSVIQFVERLVQEKNAELRLGRGPRSKYWRPEGSFRIEPP